MKITKPLTVLLLAAGLAGCAADKVETSVVKGELGFADYEIFDVRNKSSNLLSKETYATKIVIDEISEDSIGAKIMFDYSSGIIGDEPEDWVQTSKAKYSTEEFVDQSGKHIAYNSTIAKKLQGEVTVQLAKDNDLYQKIISASGAEIRKKF